MKLAPAFVVFLGGMNSETRVEAMLADALRCAAFDSLDRALRSRAFSKAILVVDGASRAEGAPSGVEVDVSAGGFHFGRRLRGVIERHGIESLVYAGAGATPLLSAEALSDIARQTGANGAVIANNLYSSDLVAFPTASALDVVERAARDNVLARLLRDECGMQGVELARTCAAQFDIDSPGDLAILSLRGDMGPRLGEFVRSTQLETGALRRAAAVLADNERQALVAGRIGSWAWQHLERETACRVRVFSEERGMEAAGRSTGVARSLLGLHLEVVGCERFFVEMSELADAVFLDTRVLLAHAAVSASRTDRFLSDLRQPEEIRNPWLRELTQAAVEAKVPVVLGGHSLMAGGLISLTESAWADRDGAALGDGQKR